MSAVAGRSYRPRGGPIEPIKGRIHRDVKAHAIEVADARGISLSVYLEELIVADMNAQDSKEAEPPDQLALTA